MIMGAPKSDDGVLIYLSYGDPEVTAQTIFSIMSAQLMATYPPAITVYCDRPELFGDLGVETVAVDRTKLDGWLGGSDYIHRRKTCVVLDALNRFERITFLDSDTYFLRPPERLWSRIGPGRACFHLREGFVESTCTPSDNALEQQLQRGKYHSRSGDPLVFPTPKLMWNTGVIGINRHDRATVEEALFLSDEIWRDADPQGAFGKKIHHAEQFAMGYAMSNLVVSETADLVFHYWPQTQKAIFSTQVVPALAAGVRGQALYDLRPRDRGWHAYLDAGKMALRRVALDHSIQIRGVRRNIM